MTPNILKTVYLIARLPEYNFDELRRGAFVEDCPAPVDGKGYRGIDRMPWFDFYEAHLQDLLESAEDRSLFSAWSKSKRVCGISVIDKLSDAQKILEVCNRIFGCRNEIVQIREISKDEILSNKPIDFEFIGIEVYVDGYGSMIRSGVFEHMEYFREYIPNLTNSGLLDNFDTVLDYARRYYGLAELEKVEPFLGSYSCFQLYAKT